ncbi:MAG: DnaJ domain-containing protein [Eubacteriaceae bacterium]|nr:DnaJ domain-containing protein [Eubacteriaceae bacterium]
MGNPYEILEINEGASEEEIKAAYKKMVKKYHPDRYQNNPLADLAEEKLREVNEAYDYLMKNGAGSSGGYGGGYSGNSSAAAPEFAKIRRDLDANNLAAAEDGLRRVNIKNAEWIFLNGMLSYKKGRYDEAVSDIQQACNMEPNNTEYRRALNTLMSAGGGYRQQAMGRGYGGSDDLLCSACQCYICGDCAGCW